jgi:uncharacterized protein
MKNLKFFAIAAGLIALGSATSTQAGGSSLKSGLNRVTFQSEGVNMVGNLFLPQSYRVGQKLPTVIVTGTWTSVKEMMANTYARKLADQGFAALTFDFRFYGESGGAPRNYENPTAKALDIRNAARYLQTVSAVDGSKIGGLAVCASAGYMAQAIADGASIKSFVTSAAWFHNAELARAIYGGAEGVQAKLEAAKAARAKFNQTGVVDYVPAYSTTDKNAAMFGEFDYYGNAKRGGIPQWGNQFAVMAWENWLNYDPIQYATRITAPTLVIHSDNAALPQGARAFFDGLKGPKNMFWTQGAHFDFYDNDAEVSRAAKVAAIHFSSTL